MAHDPTPTYVTDPPTPIRALPLEQDGPVGRAPERDSESVGSRLYRAAAPLVGRADAERIKKIANLLDEAPAVAEQLSRAWSGLSGGQHTPAQAPQHPPPQTSRRSMIVIAVLSTALASLVAVTLTGAVLWARELQERLDLHDRQIEKQSQLVETLTRHVVGRMDALGEVTGANHLDSWTPTPASLRIVALQGDVDREQSE